MPHNRRSFLVLSGVAVAAAAFPFSARSADKLKIGVIGAGNVGIALGSVWVKAGHAVMFSSRHIEDDRALAQRLGGGASAGTSQEAAAFGDVLLFSVPYGALPELIRRLRTDAAAFNQAKTWSVAGLTVGFLLWQVGFVTIGGEWFAMWQSQEWNGVPSAFRFLMTILGVLILVMLPDGEIERSEQP